MRSWRELDADPTRRGVENKTGVLWSNLASIFMSLFEVVAERGADYHDRVPICLHLGMTSAPLFLSPHL